MTSSERQKTIAILQSNYIPWKGYFDIIRRADLFIVLDEVQSTKNDWRNRNQVKTAGGVTWLSVPVHHSTASRICDVQIADHHWSKKHYRTIAQAYAKAPFFSANEPWLHKAYEHAGVLSLLSDVNKHFIHAICGNLGITTEIANASSFLPSADLDALSPTERLVKLCQKVGGTRYLTGPAARTYLNLAAFEQADIAVEWMTYDHYPPYTQLHGDFRHQVSILDLILMTGPEALRYIDP